MTIQELAVRATEQANFARNEEDARMYFNENTTQVLWLFNLTLHQSKFDRFAHFVKPEPVVVFVTEGSVYQMHHIKVLESGILSRKVEKTLYGTQFFDTQEECFDAFQKELKGAKDWIFENLEKNVFKRIREGEALSHLDI